MNWFNKLERKFGRFAIQNLMSYIIVANAAILALYLLIPYVGASVIDKLTLRPTLVLQGEIWRLITFIFIPPTLSAFGGIISLFFYYSISNSLEGEWGAFRFNIYYLVGIIGTAVASMIFTIPGIPLYLNMSLFLAYAKIYAENQVLLFFIIPIKVKYLAWLYWFALLSSVISGGLPAFILIAVSLANYLLFFGKSNVSSVKHNRKVAHRQREFKKDRPTVIYIHRCSVCGITDRDNPDMDFRYCSKCDGDYEYCADHIFDHKHN